MLSLTRLSATVAVNSLFFKINMCKYNKIKCVTNQGQTHFYHHLCRRPNRNLRKWCNASLF